MRVDRIQALLGQNYQKIRPIRSARLGRAELVCDRSEPFPLSRAFLGRPKPNYCDSIVAKADISKAFLRSRESWGVNR